LIKTLCTVKSVLNTQPRWSSGMQQWKWHCPNIFSPCCSAIFSHCRLAIFIRCRSVILSSRWSAIFRPHFPSNVLWNYWRAVVQWLQHSTLSLENLAVIPVLSCHNLETLNCSSHSAVWMSTWLLVN